MIELLLEAERAVTHGRLDRADTLYWQIVERDPHNSIAVVGLARVALEREDERTALQFARKALAVDPDNVAAQRLVARLEEVLAYRDHPDAAKAARADAQGVGAPRADAARANAQPTRSTKLPGVAVPAPEPASTVDEQERRGRFGRLFGRS